jgi:hypothetical protein
MRYRIISSTHGNNILEHYPLLDRFDIEGISNGAETCYYITLVRFEELYDLMNYVGAIVIDNYVVSSNKLRWYYEPTIEIYDGPRE